ncbi:MAG TPA: TPM domain-containing protein [Lysobacter sp.]|nr:TPM domain-containing protein [Lysobacter sp.]
MRLFRHLFAPSTARMFPEASVQRIADAIAEGERRHRGEVCFAVEAALPPAAVWAGMDARARALEVFSQLRVWDTEANNGVLLYLLLADHRIEIVADRGFHDRVGADDWRAICAAIEQRLRAGRAEEAVLHGIAAITDCVARHFPRAEGEHDHNELPDRPHVLR